MFRESSTLTETLSLLNAQGYQISEDSIDAIPDEALTAHDWRLDMVKEVNHKSGPSTIVIAVSSAARNLKIVFTEAVHSAQEYSPVALLKKLFPQRK